MPVDLTTAGAYLEMLKTVYWPRLINTIERENVILSEFEKAVPGINLIGGSIVLGVKTDRTSGMIMSSSTTDTVDLPTGGQSRFDQQTIALVRMYGSFSVPDIVMDRMSVPMGAWVNPWKEELTDIQESMRDILNKIYMGDGTGKLATVSAFSNGSPDTITVDSTRALKVGMVIDFVRSGSDVANAVDVTITAITSETVFQATMTGTPAADDIIVIANGYNKASAGLARFNDNTLTSFQGVDRTTNLWAQSNVVHNGAGGGTAVVLSLKKAKQLINQIRRVGRVKPDFVLCTSDIKDAIPWVLRPDNRFDQSRTVMKAYDSGFDFDGIPIYIDEDMNNDRMYFVYKADMLLGRIGRTIEPHVIPGASWIRPGVTVSTVAYNSAFEASYKHVGNIALARAKTQGMLDELLPLSSSSYGRYGGVTVAE